MATVVGGSNLLRAEAMSVRKSKKLQQPLPKMALEDPQLGAWRTFRASVTFGDGYVFLSNLTSAASPFSARMEPSAELSCKRFQYCCHLRCYENVSVVMLWIVMSTAPVDKQVSWSFGAWFA